jgi:hypothetical protein
MCSLQAYLLPKKWWFKAAVWRLYVHVPAWTVMAQIVCQDTEGGKKSVVLLTLAA